MKLIYFFLGFFVLGSCHDKKVNNAGTIQNENHEIEVYNFEELQEFLNSDQEMTYVVNFWATWCNPCVQELPVFDEVQRKYQNKVKVILVSLDLPNQMDSQLKPFVKDHKVRSQVVILDAPHENEWIPKVDTTWSGAIPATLIFNGSKRIFYERSFTMEELKNEIVKFTKI